MHQEHNIPWNTLTSNFQYVHNDKRFTPPYTGLIPLNRPTQSKELNYFVSKLTSTIREFAVTERQKYPSASDIIPPEDGLLFSDELLNKYTEYLNTRNQRLDFWIESALRVTIASPGHPPRYTTSDGGLADVVKILIHENQGGTLLMLASHPDVPLHTLTFLSWGHHFGVHRIVEAALEPYIFWNFVSSSGHLASGAYKEMEVHKRIVTDTTGTKDYDAQQIPHREFYGGSPPAELPDINIPQLHEYLKHLFRLFYIFDMVMVECQTNPGWEREIVTAIWRRYGLRFETKWVDDGVLLHYF